MRATFVIPPSGFLLDERVFPALGVLRVAATLEAAGYRVDVVDMSGTADFEGTLTRHVTKAPSDWYGVTATTPQLPGAVRIARIIRELRPTAKLVLGGPHVTLLNAAARKEATPGRARNGMAALGQYFDVLVAGDGERAVFATMQECGPLIDADDPKGALFLDSDALNSAPLPARHLIDLPSYHYAIDGRRAQSLVAQLGCPFSCGFCGGRSSPTFRRVRLRSQEQVIAELRHLHEDRGYTGFMFQDDELNVNPGMVPLMHAIAELQASLGVEFRLRGFVKSQLLTDAQAWALKAAGFRELLVGFEAADDRILLNIRKKATRADNERCLEIAGRHGLRVKALMSVGHAGETDGTVLAVRDWLIKMAPADFDVTVITVYPGTPYFDEAIQNGDAWTYTAPDSGDRLHYRALDFTQDEPYYKGIPGSYRSFVWTDALSSDELVRLRDSVEADVRTKLGIPWPTRWAQQFDHSMGQRNEVAC
jgi:anaerobic magnesium-protoporphyrin IX monomethyl ester cyclase